MASYRDDQGYAPEKGKTKIVVPDHGGDSKESDEDRKHWAWKKKDEDK